MWDLSNASLGNKEQEVLFAVTFENVWYFLNFSPIIIETLPLQKHDSSSIQIRFGEWNPFGAQYLMHSIPIPLMKDICKIHYVYFQFMFGSYHQLIVAVAYNKKPSCWGNCVFIAAVSSYDAVKRPGPTDQPDNRSLVGVILSRSSFMPSINKLQVCVNEDNREN